MLLSYFDDSYAIRVQKTVKGMRVQIMTSSNGPTWLALGRLIRLFSFLECIYIVERANSPKILSPIFLEIQQFSGNLSPIFPEIFTFPVPNKSPNPLNGVPLSPSPIFREYWGQSPNIPEVQSHNFPCPRMSLTWTKFRGFPEFTQS